MSKDQQHVFRLGVFVVVGAILLMLGAYFIGEKQHLFGSTFRLSAFFSNVNGLQPGNNVRFGGVNVGTVEKIVIENDSTLRVEMKLTESIREHIKKDAIASIGTDGIVGNMVVNINWGKGDMPAVESGDVLPTYSRIAAADMLNTLGKTNENFAIFSNDLLEITENIAAGKGTIAMLIQDEQLAADLKYSISGIKATTELLNDAGRQLNTIFDEIHHGDGLFATLLQDMATFQRIDHIISKLEDSNFYDQLDSTMYYLRVSSERISGFSQELNQLAAGLESGEGMLGVMLKDSLLAGEFQETMKNINEGSLLLNENLEAMRHNFLFKKYFKKKEKEEKKKTKSGD